MNKLIYLLFVLLCTTLAFAWLDNVRCEASTDCEIGDYVVNISDHSQVYSSASCNITVKNQSNFLLVGETALTSRTDGYFYYNLNNATTGFFDYTVLCQYLNDFGRSTGKIIIGTPLSDNQVTILANQATLSSDLDGIESSMSSNFTDIDTKLNANFTFIINNLSDLESIGNTGWITATGFVTPSELSVNITRIVDNMTNLELHGDDVWTTGNIASVVNEVFDYTIEASGLSFNETIGAIYQNTTLYGSVVSIVVDADTIADCVWGVTTSCDQDRWILGIEG